MTKLLSVELVRPHVGLKGADPSNKLARLTYGKYSFLCHTETGRAEWEQISTDIMRLVLQADQGGPLYAAYQFLAGKGYPVAFSRDEHRNGFKVEEDASLNFDRVVAVLHKVGRNPFVQCGKGEGGEDYEKALLDEEAHRLFSSLSHICKPWCDMVLWLQSNKATNFAVHEHTLFCNSPKYAAVVNNVLVDAFSVESMSRLDMAVDLRLEDINGTQASPLLG
ncbi:hemA [Symbiodinium natans]|uniref:HemA protein n=1 Tax=Symbiodinium natans TaxID=878477 RepID=A0A812NWS2_9DINO|nr:hemA [Symbiodinium natans]